MRSHGSWPSRRGLAELHAAPGNPGIGRVATLHDVPVSELEAMTELASRLAVDLVVVGPEAPLAAGLADRMADAGIACFGASAAAARIESSKAFAKTVMQTAGVPTARAVVCDTLAAAHAAIAEAEGRVVIKADGLAAGKGVTVCGSVAEAHDAVKAASSASAFGSAGRRVLVEELLEGDELSLLALCDGEHVVALAGCARRQARARRRPRAEHGRHGVLLARPRRHADLVDEIVATIAPARRERARPARHRRFGAASTRGSW